MNESYELISSIFDEYKTSAKEDITSVLEPVRSFVVVYSTHGVISNGGFRYFFENNFERLNGYQVVNDSYRNIGLNSHADAIKKF